MKNLRNVILAVWLISFTSGLSAQVKLDKGNPSALKGVKRVNITYEYSNMAVGSFDTEQGYLDKKEEDFKSEPGKIDKFKKGWFGARKARYEPKFEELFNKYGEKIGMHGINYSKDAPVTLIVETVFTEPGFNVGVVKKAASANFKCTFVKDNKVVLVYLVNKVKGRETAHYEFDAGSRIEESYAKCAKLLMKELTKRLKK